MKKEKTVILDRAGVDEASETVSQWLEEAGTGHRDITRIRLILEEMLVNICEHGQGKISARLSFSRRSGAERLRISYGGDRFDPRKPADNGMEEYTASLMTRIGILPVWRWRFGQNELIVPVAAPKKKAELFMLGCILVAVVVGLLGQYIPEPVRNTVMDYGLVFLSTGFLHMLNTFIGLMIFLTVLTGICGIGSAAAFGRRHRRSRD